MVSWITWPVERLAGWLSDRRVRKIQKALRKDERYVDAQRWASLNGISREAAQQELERAEHAGVFKKMFLYEGSDSPISFIVPASWLGRRIRLSEIGYFGDDEGTDVEDREVVVARSRTKPVYVAAGEPAGTRAYAG